MSIIAVEHLTKRYGPRVGVSDLCLEVSAGAVFGFLGPNGAGKSTTIRTLVGLLRPNGGRARVFGLDCWGDGRRVRADVGYLPGDLRLYPWLTGRAALAIVGRIRGQDLTDAGEALAQRFALDLNVKVRSMSRGMRQKLGLILALAHRPKLLILDEPTSGLDPIMQDRLKEHLGELAARGHTVFFSSHSLAEVEDLCDQVAILRNGRLVACETVDTLRDRARRRVCIRWERHARAPIPSPPSLLLDIERRDDEQWEASLLGTVPELVRWLADKPIDDLTVSQPDLEQVFRQYYEQPAAES
ncbi:MAG: ABC transporter ATP-binding protein [bacterium]|nr:ABC transporter ATP-binding protein [bacterium]